MSRRYTECNDGKKRTSIKVIGRFDKQEIEELEALAAHKGREVSKLLETALYRGIAELKDDTSAGISW